MSEILSPEVVIPNRKNGFGVEITSGVDAQLPGALVARVRSLIQDRSTDE